MTTHSSRHFRHDRYYRQAKKAGYAARSVYKLEEIHSRFQLFRAGQRVLDLGCAPGSWMQWVSRIVGPMGRIVGVDRSLPGVKVPNARVIVGDIFALSTAELLEGIEYFDVVISDMAPDTTGIRGVDQARSEALAERALDVAETTLAAGGALVVKLFQGPGTSELLKRCRRGFERAEIVKPRSSRRESTEIYIVAVRRQQSLRKNNSS